MTTDVIQLPEAPGLRGLRFRRFRAGEDFRHMSTILRLSAEVDGTERAETPEELETFFAHLTNCDPYTDMIFAEVDPGDGRDPEVIGYSRGGWRIRDRERLYSFFVRILPRWRGQGIGRAMLGWMEGRLREIAAGHPPEIEKYFLIFVGQGETNMAAMLEKTGYQPFRYSFEMVRPNLENIPDTPLPDGLEVRRVLSEHYQAIWDADIEAFRDDWGFTEPSEEDYQGWLADTTTFQPELWQVAWDIATNQVAGQVRTYIDHEQNKLYHRQRGWTEDISVRRPYRRRGLARALIARSLRAQKQAGMTESALGVDSENLSGATRVYEACGFRVVKKNTLYRKPLITIGQT